MTARHTYPIGPGPAPGKQDNGRVGDLAGPHKLAWKRAIRELISPAFRLHRYREAHNRLLQDALTRRDCPPVQHCGSHE